MVGNVGELESVDDDGTLKLQLNKSIKHVREFTAYNNWGIDSVPAIGTKVYADALGSQNDRIGLGCRRPDDQNIAKPGEARIFSAFGSQIYLKDDGEILIENSGGATITLKDDGKIEINGNAQSSMTFQDFKTVWDAFIVAYEAHIHTDSVPGPTSPPTVPLTGPQKDMSPAENDQVLLNG